MFCHARQKTEKIKLRKNRIEIKTGSPHEAECKFLMEGMC